VPQTREALEAKKIIFIDNSRKGSRESKCEIIVKNNVNFFLTPSSPWAKLRRLSRKIGVKIQVHEVEKKITKTFSSLNHFFWVI
jgi:hypothetical protein